MCAVQQARELMACAPRIKCSCADDDDVGERDCALHDAPRPHVSRDARRDAARLARCVTTFSKHNSKLYRAVNDFPARDETKFDTRAPLAQPSKSLSPSLLR